MITARRPVSRLHCSPGLLSSFHDLHREPRSRPVGSRPSTGPASILSYGKEKWRWKGRSGNRFLASHACLYSLMCHLTPCMIICMFYIACIAHFGNEVQHLDCQTRPAGSSRILLSQHDSPGRTSSRDLARSRHSFYKLIAWIYFWMYALYFHIISCIFCIACIAFLWR